MIGLPVATYEQCTGSGGDGQRRKLEVRFWSVTAGAPAWPGCPFMRGSFPALKLPAVLPRRIRLGGKPAAKGLSRDRLVRARHRSARGACERRRGLRALDRRTPIALARARASSAPEPARLGLCRPPRKARRHWSGGWPLAPAHGEERGREQTKAPSADLRRRGPLRASERCAYAPEPSGSISAAASVCRRASLRALRLSA